MLNSEISLCFSFGCRLAHSGLHFASLGSELTDSMIGDSLSLQQMRAHENIFTSVDGPVQVTMQGDWEWYPLSRHLVLDRNHPDVPDLLLEAGVSIERLDYPLLSWYRTWHLLWHDRLFDAFKGIPEFDFHDQNTKNGVLDWHAEATAKISAANSRVTYREDVRAEATAMVFHGGAHFTSDQLGLTLSDDQLVEGYSRTVGHIMQSRADCTGRHHRGDDEIATIPYELVLANDCTGTY